MASSPPEKPPLSELEYRQSFHRREIANQIIQLAIKWGILGYIFHCLYLMVLAFAGRSTFADIGIRVFGNVKVSDGIITVLAGGGWVYGLGQRQLRRKIIKRNVPAKNALEKLLNPTRTSSNLTDVGTTPKEGEHQ